MISTKHSVPQPSSRCPIWITSENGIHVHFVLFCDFVGDIHNDRNMAGSREDETYVCKRFWLNLTLRRILSFRCPSNTSSPNSSIIQMKCSLITQIYNCRVIFQGSGLLHAWRYLRWTPHHFTLSFSLIYHSTTPKNIGIFGKIDLSLSNTHQRH